MKKDNSPTRRTGEALSQKGYKTPYTDKEENLIIISQYIRLNIKITKISFNNIASKYLSKNLQNSKEKQTNP